MHIYDQACLENGYRFGIRHFPISNYYPSAPCDANTRLSDFRLHQHWPAVTNDGELAPPINWNDVITWSDELEDQYRSQLPFVETAPVYSRIPDDVVLSHNAEHHGFSNSPCHICSPGSSFASGTFDVGNRYRLNQHGFAVGYGGRWQDAFAGMIAALDYPDAGGITINHPTWFTQLTDDQVFELLDFDSRVLGLEIYNDYSARKDWFQNPGYRAPSETEQGYSLNLWDRVLASGRRCWGFCVPDHAVCRPGNWSGRTVLLVDRFTDYDCLCAYRHGRFYGCLKDSGLTVTAVTVTETSVAVGLNAPATISFITDAGLAQSSAGLDAEFELPCGCVYVRIEIADNDGERLFLQPLMC